MAPNNDFPQSWTVDTFNAAYWGNTLECSPSKVYWMFCNGTNSSGHDAKMCGAGDDDAFRPTHALGYHGGESNVCPGSQHLRHRLLRPPARNAGAGLLAACGRAAGPQLLC